MTRIFLTGDTHNSTDIKKLNIENFKEQKDLTKNDYLIILGDFGFPWTYGESKEDKYWLDWLNDKNFTTLFLDGNHENFDQLYTYPIVKFNGAKCHKLRDSVYHIMRGEITTLNNTNFLCMGGALSIDRVYRKENISWWKEENPTYKEWERAFINIDKADVILTHDAPYSVLNQLLRAEKDEVNKTLDRLLERNTRANKRYFGHHHIEEHIKYKGVDFYALYNNIVEIKDKNT